MSSPIFVTLTTLHCLPIFRNIPDPQLELLIPVCRALEYDEGETILNAGDTSSDFYLVLSGTVRVALRREIAAETREKEVVLAFLNAGDFFGELSMIDAAPRSASVFAETSCCVVSVAGSDFREVSRRNADITFHMLKNMASRLRNSDDKIRSFALQDVASRVLSELDALAKSEGSVNIIKTRVSRQDLAKRVGASREMVGRALRDLEKNKQITMEDGKLIINK